MKFGSLFSGIGGIDLGLERAGMQCVWQVENNEYAQKILEKHWPNVRRWDDVRTFQPEGEWGCDLIAGGFPCQDISNAGKRAGIDGERSGLWSEFARIVRVVRPRFVLVENVAALLGRGLGRVVGDLAECGYDSEWDCLPAAAFGAPHIRQRVFIVAHAASWRCGPRRAKRKGFVGALSFVGNGSDASDNDSGDSGQKGSGLRKEASGRRRKGTGPANLCNDVSEADRKRPQRRWLRGPIAECDWWKIEPNVGRVANGIPDRVDRLRGLGNAVVPQVAQWIGERIMESIKCP